MEEKDGAYEVLMKGDRAVAPRRYYTISLVTRRKNRIMEILLPLTQLEKIEDVDRHRAILRISKILGAAASGEDSASRKPFRDESNTSLGDTPFNDFLDGVPFLSTPEETDPRGKPVYVAVEDSLGLSLEQVPSIAQIRTVAWRLAGNVHKLADHKPVLQWDAEIQNPEWCLARVAEVVDAVTYQGEPGFRLSYFFYSGAPAGIELSRVFRNGFETRFANALGISWRDAKLIYPQELTNMTGYVRLEPGMGKDNLPVFRETIVTSSHKLHNRKLYEDRLDPAKCKYSYKPEQFTSCMDCPLSHEESSGPGASITCRLALRRKCPDGHNAGSPHAAAGGDPVVRSGA